MVPGSNPGAGAISFLNSRVFARLSPLFARRAKIPETMFRIFALRAACFALKKPIVSFVSCCTWILCLWLPRGYAARLFGARADALRSSSNPGAGAISFLNSRVFARGRRTLQTSMTITTGDLLAGNYCRRRFALSNPVPFLSVRGGSSWSGACLPRQRQLQCGRDVSRVGAYSRPVGKASGEIT